MSEIQQLMTLRERFPGFIQDTYQSTTQGYEEALQMSLKQLGYKGGGYGFSHFASNGSVMSQYLVIFWSAHEESTWDWRLE